MKILLVGGHQDTNILTKSLKAKNHNITIINENYEWCKMLSNTHEVLCVHGDGTKPYILNDAGVANMDVVVALSNKDANNLITCEISKCQFNITNNVALVNDPKNVKLFNDLGVYKCISATQMLVDIIEQEVIVDNLKSLLPLENGKILVGEVELDENSPVMNKKLWEINFPQNSIIGCVIRQGSTIIPQGNTELKAGDKVIIISTPDAVDKIMNLLSKRHGK
jgi:trk system potassium uptake protein TrkA